MNITITPEQLAAIPPLARGEHEEDSPQRCVMEVIASLTGERHSDLPQCVDWLITIVARAANDTLPDDQRQRLIGYIPRMIGAHQDHATTIRRAHAAGRYADAILPRLSPGRQSAWARVRAAIRSDHPLIWRETFSHATTIVQEIYRHDRDPRIWFDLLDAMLAVEGEELEPVPLAETAVARESVAV